MSLDVLKKYISMCRELKITPTFEGLKIVEPILKSKQTHIK